MFADHVNSLNSVESFSESLSEVLGSRGAYKGWRKGAAAFQAVLSGIPIDSEIDDFRIAGQRPPPVPPRAHHPARSPGAVPGAGGAGMA